MIYSPQDLLGTTESLLKYDEDERLSEAAPQHLHNALGRAVMIAVGDNWAKSRARRAGKRKAYYLSAEYLVGRLVYNNLFNLGILDEMRRVFAERGIDLACLEEIEDAALGNGGLGRLAACFMDSMATEGLQATGYSICYELGIFKQKIVEGQQVELPDDWQDIGGAWLLPRPQETEEVHFGGTVRTKWDGGQLMVVHEDYTRVLAVPCDMEIAGYKTDHVNTLRLWQARSPKPVDM